MRLIDVDALEYHKQLEAFGNGQYEDVEVVYKCDIDNAPTIDAVEVVRCKDCVVGKYPETATCQMRRILGDNGYCSIGERREESENE